MESTPETSRRVPAALRVCALSIAVIAFVALRVVAAERTAGNWDEYGLLESTSQTAETGALVSGGRPGLAQLLVLPLVAACADEIEVLVAARLLWVPITLLVVVGVGAWVAVWQRDPTRRAGDALLAVGLVAMVPEFLEWSIQVRTDQIALVGGVWGGALLLASIGHPALALPAGVAFGIGFLSSQKLLYVAALAGLLAVAQLLRARQWRPRRETVRALLCAAAFALCLGGFQVAVTNEIAVAADHPSKTVVSGATLRGGLDAFDFYRKTIGYSQYAQMLPSLVPHFVLLAALGFATARAIARRREGEVVAVAWAVIALGVAVGLFHAAAFAYFWMTLGLFPAVAFAIARRPLEDLVDPRWRTAALGGFGLLLVAPGAWQLAAMLDDTLAVQRDSLRFVNRNFDGDSAGFHPESALFCRGDAQPIRHYYSSTIYRSFGRPGSEANRERLIEQFRAEPVLFLVESFRLNQFPVEVRRFWAENYQPYRDSVFVAGRRLAGAAGAESAFELIAPGEYRWLPFEGPQPLRIDGHPVGPGEVVRLDGGPHVARFEQDVPGGMLVLALAEPPGRAPLAFYKTY